MFSSTSGPFQRQYPQAAAQTPFQRLKPACVELLSLAGRSTGPVQTQQVVACLRRLQAALKALITNIDDRALRNGEPTASTSRLIGSDTQPALSPALVNYIFYPLSELIRSAPKGITSLPDSICEATLEVLELLCSQWWAAWVGETEKSAVGKGWQVWCDLVILASSVLGAPSSKDKVDAEARSGASDEVKVAALRVLTELLSPRFRAQQVTGPDANKAKAKEDEWEWDGPSSCWEISSG
uniref:TTI1 N-terminal TPR domain-containing protein n=1 Tax=Kalmanozyma brasiliensis (strain GHG001) TaxID=1365824 RepID=V5EYV8_KALBG